jgi:hypothetical protein
MLEAQSLSAHRGRRVLIGLLAVALILLPLYLWPLRLGLGGLSNVAALLGIVGDPRDPAAVARIPQEAWEVLMGDADAPPFPSGGATTPRNLTMIADLEELTGGVVDAGPGALLGEDSAVAPSLLAAAGGPGGVAAAADPAGESSGSAPSGLLAASPGGGSADGPGSNWSQFGGGFRDLGPWSGGGGPLLLTTAAPFGPGSDPVAPTPTPEPATLLLIGSNAALLGAAAWKRRRRRRGTTPIG